MTKTKKILSLFIVVLFISHYVDSHFFVHEHIIAGEKVVHSHFHIDFHHDHPNGFHTEESVVLISQISNAEFIVSFCNYFLCPLELQLFHNKITEVFSWISSIYFENLSLRAPPVV